ncbi:MAG: pyruvate formate-lyase-activating protein [Syntrophomonadaceae bacterium]|jgi:pyruvate formate lyase activating enzyme
MIGRIHSLDTFSTLDGPGIRTVIFLQGCHLRCKYCHNPDTWDMKSCTAREYSSEELMAIIRRSIPYFRASGGGVTFSGGEPLLQHDFVKEMCIRCQEEEISTAIDTSLYVTPDVLSDLLPYTDLILADIKAINDEKSRYLTGASNRLNLANLKLIDENQVPIWIRYVVVPGLTDDLQDLEEMAAFIAGLPSVKRVDLLPYHSLGAHKWELLGLKYELANTPPPTKDHMQKIQKLVADLSGKEVNTN